MNLRETQIIDEKFFDDTSPPKVVHFYKKGDDLSVIV